MTMSDAKFGDDHSRRRNPGEAVRDLEQYDVTRSDPDIPSAGKGKAVLILVAVAAVGVALAFGVLAGIKHYAGSATNAFAAGPADSAEVAPLEAVVVEEEEPKLIPDRFLGEWILMREDDDGRRYIPLFCDAATPTVTVRREADGWYMDVVYGQDGERFTIGDARKAADGSYEVVLRSEFTDDRQVVMSVEGARAAIRYLMPRAEDTLFAKEDAAAGMPLLDTSPCDEVDLEELGLKTSLTWGGSRAWHRKRLFRITPDGVPVRTMACAGPDGTLHVVYVLRKWDGDTLWYRCYEVTSRGQRLIATIPYSAEYCRRFDTRAGIALSNDTLYLPGTGGMLAYPVGSGAEPAFVEAMKPVERGWPELVWSPDSSRMVEIASRGQRLLLWEPRGGRQEGRALVSSNADYSLMISTVDWSYDDDLILFDNTSALACIWMIDLGTRELTKIVPEHEARCPYLFAIKGRKHVVYFLEQHVMLAREPAGGSGH
jgi:hypothetical protein